MCWYFPCGGFCGTLIIDQCCFVIEQCDKTAVLWQSDARYDGLNDAQMQLCLIVSEYFALIFVFVPHAAEVPV